MKTSLKHFGLAVGP